MTDVDYIVVENPKSGTQHIAIQSSGEHLITPCGLYVGKSNIIDKKMRSWWKSTNACGNCKRAAKR